MGLLAFGENVRALHEVSLEMNRRFPYLMLNPEYEPRNVSWNEFAGCCDLRPSRKKKNPDAKDD